MSRKTAAVIFGILIVVFFAGRIVYKLYTFSTSLEAERNRYAKALFYNFSSRLDSVALKKGKPGTLYCTVTGGTINYLVEDSLAKTLIHHTSLRFNESTAEGQIQFVMPGAERWETGDSLVVNSQLNQLTFFRKGNQIYTDRFSNLLEGRVTRGL